MKKILALLLLTSVSQITFANDTIKSIPVEHYKYGDTLDIAKVIEIDTPADDVCSVVTTHMLYLDSKGVKHNLEYNIMGTGCSNGS